MLALGANCRLHDAPTFPSYCQRLNFQVGADFSANISKSCQKLRQKSKVAKISDFPRCDSSMGCIKDAFQTISTSVSTTSISYFGLH